jgi:hypothetical protein
MLDESIISDSGFRGKQTGSFLTVKKQKLLAPLKTTEVSETSAVWRKDHQATGRNHCCGVCSKIPPKN